MQDSAQTSPAERVMVISIMKSGTHLIQELMVALGYGIYGQSRIPQEIRPVFDAGQKTEILRMVHGKEEAERLTQAGGGEFDQAAAAAWDAYGWAWQQRLGLPLANRYGIAVTRTELIDQALQRTVDTPFAATPANVCWVLPELDIKKVDGAFLGEWCETGSPRIIFMYRDPRDVLLSMVNFLSGLTVQGYGNFAEFQVFNSILRSKPDLAAKLTYALSDPCFPGMGDFHRCLWMLNHPDVCAVSFEDLVGAKGGGSDERQRETVDRVCRFLGRDADSDALREALFNRDSFSFFKGQIGSWREAFSPEHKALMDSRLGEAIAFYGYE